MAGPIWVDATRAFVRRRSTPDADPELVKRSGGTACGPCRCPGVGHFPVLEEPGRFNHRLGEVVEGLRARR